MAEIRKLSGQEFYGSEITGKNQAEVLRTVAEILERSDRFLTLESLSFCSCDIGEAIAVVVLSEIKPEVEDQLQDFLTQYGIPVN